MRFSCKLGRIIGAVSIFSMAALSGSCGSDKAKSQAGSHPAGVIEAAFAKASRDNQIPVRILIAVGLLESGLNSQRQSANYPGLSLSSSLTETAFGIGRRKLGIPQDAAGDALPLQIAAYASWLRASLELKKIALKPNPANSNEVYDWIWQLAQLHRDSQNERRNIRVLFAMELIEFLNKGGIWQDPESQDILELTKEQTPITFEKLAPEIQQTMTLTTEEGPFPAARFFEMTYVRSDDRKNKPTHIRVIHCPLTLSACLELQNPSNDDDRIRLGAHYIIPAGRNDFNNFNKILQVSQHRDVLEITNKQGYPESVQDAIIVMLIGDSGHYVAGSRVATNPTWFTDDQLMKLGNLVKNVCPLIQGINPEVDIAKCITPGTADGIRFIHQDRSEQFQWGDVPDFTEAIFYAYIKNPQGLPGNASFEFSNAQKIYAAGQPLEFKVRFLTGAARVVVEKAERCDNGKIVWTGLQSVQVRNTNIQPFQTTLFYKGPNGNGQQFFRTMVYNVDNNLAGWAVDSIILKGYDKEAGPGPSLDDCSSGGG